MDATLQAGLQARIFRLFAAVTVSLWNGATLRLLDGDIEIDIAAAAYAGEDPTYGRLASLEAISDGDGEQAPLSKVGLLARDDDAVDVLIDPRMQGCAVTIALGVVDSLTGLCVGVPEPVFLGEVDVPVFSPSKTARYVETDCVSVFERMFDRDEGQRLSNAYWTSVFPGDKGLEDMVDLIFPVPWGEAAVDATLSPAGIGAVVVDILRAKARS